MKKLMGDLVREASESWGSILFWLLLIAAILVYLTKGPEKENNHPLSQVLEKNRVELSSLGIKEVEFELDVSNFGNDVLCSTLDHQM